MSKPYDWSNRLDTEMAKKRNARSREVGGHSYLTQIERYGLGIMFAEMANIMSRLEQMLWLNDPKDANLERLLDLLVDLGNYTSFTYEYVWARHYEYLTSDYDSPLGEDPGSIDLSQREQGE